MIQKTLFISFLMVSCWYAYSIGKNINGNDENSSLKKTGVEDTQSRNQDTSKLVHQDKINQVKKSDLSMKSVKKKETHQKEKNDKSTAMTNKEILKEKVLKLSSMAPMARVRGSEEAKTVDTIMKELNEDPDRGLEMIAEVMKESKHLGEKQDLLAIGLNLNSSPQMKQKFLEGIISDQEKYEEGKSINPIVVLDYLSSMDFLEVNYVSSFGETLLDKYKEQPELVAQISGFLETKKPEK